MKGPGIAKKRYDRMDKDRLPFLTRARDCAKLTIPTLIPPEGTNKTTNLATPYQSLGARGVNNLASKLLLTMLPPNAPFFQFEVDSQITEALKEQDESAATKLQEALAELERRIMKGMNTSNIRVSSFEALKHLLVGGNVLTFLNKQSNMSVYPLSQYVCKRDTEGTLLEIVIKESVSPTTLSDAVLQECKVDRVNSQREKSDEKSLDLYTHIKREDKQFTRYQELNGYKIKSSESTYPLDKTPYIMLRWAKIDGEDYGRGFVEEYMGDLISLEGLMKALVQGAAAAAKVVFLIRPNSMTKHKDIVKAESGDVKTGSAEDISVMQCEKYADFKFVQEMVQNLQQRLSFTFLLNSAIQRKGERVTAQEIRYMAGELEDALGGAYSLLSQEYQLPLLKTVKNQMNKAGTLPELPDKSVAIKIVTGIEALGRKHDQDRLDALVQHLAPLGPEVLQMYLRIPDYIKRTGTNLGVDLDGLIKTEDEVNEQRQQNQRQQMIQQFGPDVIKQIGPMIQNMMQGGTHGKT